MSLKGLQRGVSVEYEDTKGCHGWFEARSECHCWVVVFFLAFVFVFLFFAGRGWKVGQGYGKLEVCDEATC